MFHLSCFSQRTNHKCLCKRPFAGLKWFVLHNNDIFSSERDSATYEKCVAAQDTASIAAPQICTTRAGDANLLGSRPRKCCNELKPPWLRSHGMNQECGSLCSMAVVQSGCQGSWVHRERRLHAGRRSWESEDRMR